MYNSYCYREIPIDAKILWLNVLNQALIDLYEFGRSHPNNTLAWFLSFGETIGSYLWICHQYSIDPKILIKDHAKRINYLLSLPDIPTAAMRKRHEEQLKRLLE